MTTDVTVQIVEGRVAPRYEHEAGGAELALEHVVITEQGTQAGLPIVDFKMRGPDGIACALAAAVRGINQRIHGTPEP